MAHSGRFQLVNYIVMAKSFQAFAVGVVPLVIAGMKMYQCFILIDDGDPNECNVGASSALSRYILMVE